MFIVKMTEVLSAMEAEMIEPKEPGVILVPGDSVPVNILQKLTANGTAAEFVPATDKEAPFLCGYFMALRSGLRVISLDESILFPKVLTQVQTETDYEPAFWPGQEEETPEFAYYDDDEYYPDPATEQCIAESYYEEPATATVTEEASEQDVRNPDMACQDIPEQDMYNQEVNMQDIPDEEIPELPPFMPEDALNDVIDTPLPAEEPAPEAVKKISGFDDIDHDKWIQDNIEIFERNEAEEAKKHDYDYLIKDDNPEIDPDDLQIYAQYKAEQETNQELRQIEDEKMTHQIAAVKSFLIECGLQEELRCVDEDEVAKQVIKAVKETKSRTGFQKKLTALLASTDYKHVSAKIYDKIFDKLEDLRAMCDD